MIREESGEKEGGKGKEKRIRRDNEDAGERNVRSEG